MNMAIIPLDGQSLYQIVNFNAKVGRITRRLRVEVRHLTYTDKWYLSVVNAQTGESYCRYVPLVASCVELNDMVALYRHKDIGWFCCVANDGSEDSGDPNKNNLADFSLVWGDGFD